jgi:hypothetical protein
MHYRRVNDSTRPRFAAGTAGAASSPPRRRGVRLLIWVVAIVVGVALAAWGALAVFFPPAKLHAMAAAKLSSMLARDVRFKGASLWLWPPVRLSVSQPAFAESGGFAHGTALEAQAIHLDLDALRLLGRRIVVRRLVLDQPAIHLELNPDGTTNFDGIMKSPGEQAQDRRSSTMELAVSELSIVDGHVLLDDLRTRRRATFRVNSKVALNAEAGGTRFATSGRDPHRRPGQRPAERCPHGGPRPVALQAGVADRARRQIRPGKEAPCAHQAGTSSRQDPADDDRCRG